MIRLLFATTVFILMTQWLACKSEPQKLTEIVKEPYRPVFHFTPPAHWMNDPNGLVYFKGEYHLFYQFNPDSTVWGPMHWGHAVSADLVHWEHLLIALYPDSIGMIFSGSVVVDHNNTSGFGLNNQPPLIAVFTHHDMEAEKNGKEDYEKQSIAYSNDKGRTWTKYIHNPVLSNQTGSRDFRDPKVFWYERSKSWIMITAVHDHIRLWSSPDLKQWTYLSDFGTNVGSHGGVWECPDLFPIGIEGTQDTIWVLLQSINPGGPSGGSGTQYFLGNFDGTRFELHPEFKPLVENGKAMWIDFGADNYAGVTWSDIPVSVDRRLFLGWMSNWAYASVVPTKSWRSAMTIPREITVRKTEIGLRMFSSPVQELQALRKSSIEIGPTTIKDSFNLTKTYGVNPSTYELELEFDVDPLHAKTLEIVFSNDTGELFKVGIDHELNTYYMDRSNSSKMFFSSSFTTSIHLAPRILKSNHIKFHLFMDLASCEFFADDGATVMTDIFFPTKPYNQISIVSPGSNTSLKSGKIHVMN